LSRYNQGFLVLPHDDPGIGAADEVAAIRLAVPPRFLQHLSSPWFYVTVGALHADSLNSNVIRKGSYN
jgi:hypothetical protein